MHFYIHIYKNRYFYNSLFIYTFYIFIYLSIYTLHYIYTTLKAGLTKLVEFFYIYSATRSAIYIYMYKYIYICINIYIYIYICI